MSKDPPDMQAKSLLGLSEEVTRIAGSLAQLSMGIAAPLRQNCAATNSNEAGVSVETVGWLIGARRDRARYLSPDLFADPAWDMLLDLLHAELGGRSVCVSSLCIASGVPITTGLRWLGILERQRLVLRKADPRDARRIFVELSPDTSKKLRRYILEIVEPGRTDRR
jgi:DNA-binding transcriptional ArsR family regulator